MTAKGTFFPRRINTHVPNMQYAADVRYGGFGTVEIPAPTSAGAAVGTVAADGDAETTAVSVDTGAKFGRNVTAVAGAAVGSGTTVVVTIKGRDYLGQPMVETISIAHATGTAAVPGKKAFKYVDSVATDGEGSVATTIAITTGDVLGLPYKAGKLTDELVDMAAPTAGAFVAGVDTQTATSGDPRGTYTPHATAATNGSRNYLIGCIFDQDNLHGNPHYFA